MVGPNIGLGLGFSIVSFSSLGLSLGVEYAHVGFVLKNYSKNNKWSFEVEPKLNIILAFNYEGAVAIAGLGMGIYYGRKIQIGIRTTIGTNSEAVLKNQRALEFYTSTSFLIIRIPIRW
ncbi:MAG: hypothetical protein A3K10_10030 [Bacteroidetes bacterium RIFCSPLOWO2_12_FULL_31_6]|nr:MAG: hypothetical protein A3K10_10030 [Bacteroidetes bacterium RIFCSPLOWO2_12_FULL_31_6]